VKERLSLERADLADLLWVSVEPKADVEAPRDEEIRRRIDDLGAGRTKANPADQMFAEVRARIQAGRKP
jgi:putative addiction module component (TIGR02574 family)